jgi:hypothetical protein
MTLDDTLSFVRLWSNIRGEHAHRRARAWWFMSEGLRYDSKLLTSVAELLLL